MRIFNLLETNRSFWQPGILNTMDHSNSNKKPKQQNFLSRMVWLFRTFRILSLEHLIGFHIPNILQMESNIEFLLHTKLRSIRFIQIIYAFPFIQRKIIFWFDKVSQCIRRKVIQNNLQHFHALTTARWDIRAWS